MTMSMSTRNLVVAPTIFPIISSFPSFPLLHTRLTFKSHLLLTCILINELTAREKKGLVRSIMHKVAFGEMICIMFVYQCLGTARPKLFNLFLHNAKEWECWVINAKNFLNLEFWLNVDS